MLFAPLAAGTSATVTTVRSSHRSFASHDGLTAIASAIGACSFLAAADCIDAALVSSNPLAGLPMNYRLPSPPLAPLPRSRSNRSLVIALGVGASVVAVATIGATFLAKSKLSTRVTIDPWQLPEPAPPPVTMAARWISAPLASPSGVVFGVVDGGATPAIVAIDGATGTLRWKTAIAAGAPLSEYVHTSGWNRNGAQVPTEFHPVVPVLGLAGPTLVIAFDHGWAQLDAATGTLRKTDRIASTLPAVAPQGGFCAIGNDAWIAMADGRDGGLQITAQGTTNGLRVDRPADCKPPVATLGEPYGYRVSPLQQVRGSAPPDFCMRKAHKARTVSNQCTLWGQGPSGTPLGADHLDLFFGKSSFAFGKPREPFAALSELGIEATATTMFVTVSESAAYSSETRPPPGSFEPVKRTSGYRSRVVLVAIDADMKARWTTSIATLDDSWGQPLVFAADPASPSQNLYLFTPGKLVAIDQATGQPRFRIEAN